MLKSIDELNDGDIIVGKENFVEVKRIINEFAAIVENVSEKLHSELNDKIQILRDQLNSWDSKEKEIQESIDKKRKELEEKGIPFDLGKINKIAQDLIYFKDRLKHLYSKDRELKDKIRYRSDMIKKRKEVKSKIYYKRLGFANQINENLKNTLDGLFVTVKFEEGKYSPQFEEVLKTTMDYRTAQVPKAKIISDTIDPISFVDSIKRRKLDQILKSITDVDKNRLFYENEIKKIEHKFNESFNYEDVECVMFEDRPKILVTKVFKNEEKESHITKPLSQLSLGQQQSILLAILLHSKNKSPLVIDQPEDNLDSEFIFKSIVKNLRTIKERRQVIIVTHNPNIAVLGDAELILPLKSTNTLSRVMDRGSIDNPETQRLSCEILEGGRQAFIQRKMIYGI